MARYIVGTLLTALATATLIGCGTTNGSSPQPSGPPSATPTAADPMTTPSIDGRFPVRGAAGVDGS
jgi:hypothetical protein